MKRVLRLLLEFCEGFCLHAACVQLSARGVRGWGCAAACCGRPPFENADGGVGGGKSYTSLRFTPQPEQQ